jgi:hypothetical protein
VRIVFVKRVKRLMSHAIAVTEEWVPPGLSRYNQRRWERLTDEQKRLVKRVYEVFKDYARNLERRVLVESRYPYEDKELSERIGASCMIYFGAPEEPSEHLDSVERGYGVAGTKTWFHLSVVHHRGKRIGVRCYIGKDKDGRDTTVEAEVPAEYAEYILHVYGDHASGVQNAIWVARVKSKEPTISFW